MSKHLDGSAFSLNTREPRKGSSVTIMAGKQFLNPLVKLIVCLIMTLIMGYFFLQSLEAAEYYEKTTWFRGAVLFGFVYLFCNSVRQVCARTQS